MKFYIQLVVVFFAVLGVIDIVDQSEIEDRQNAYNRGYYAGYTEGYSDAHESSYKQTTKPSSSSSANNSYSSSYTTPSRSYSGTSSSYTKSTTVYVTNTGSKYHKSWCSYLKSKVEMTLDEAKSRGYTACSRCY